MNPKYAIIESHLRDRIYQGLYTEDHPIESESVLCEQFAASRATVRQALSMLEKQNLIERRQGRRSYAVPPDQPYRGRLHNRVALLTYAPDYFNMTPTRTEAARLLGENGFTVDAFFVTEAQTTERAALQQVLEKDYDGLIIEGVGTGMPSFNMDLYRRIAQLRIPIVFTNGFHERVRAAHVVADDRRVMTAMVDHLVSLGHRDIGGIFAHGQQQGFMRYQGFLDGLHKHGLAFEDQRVMFLSFSDKRFIFDNLFNAYRDKLLECSAFVCYSDSFADFLEATLQRNGVTVPGGMSITGMDNLPEARVGRLSLTTATLPLVEMGRCAATTLMKMIETRRDAESTVLACEFVKGESTAKVRRG